MYPNQPAPPYVDQIAAHQIAQARMKSYTGPAVLVLVLYMVLWLPGFVANILYYSDARRMERIAGYALPGSGCLTVMLWLNVASVVIGIVGACVVIVLGLLGVITLPFLFGYE
jgi:hypothetical protein